MVAAPHNQRSAPKSGGPQKLWEFPKKNLGKKTPKSQGNPSIAFPGYCPKTTGGPQNWGSRSPDWAGILQWSWGDPKSLQGTPKSGWRIAKFGPTTSKTSREPQNWGQNLQQHHETPKLETPKLEWRSQKWSGDLNRSSGGSQNCPKTAPNAPKIPLTASSSSFFILLSVFIFPEPFPWKRWESCRKAWGHRGHRDMLGTFGTLRAWGHQGYWGTFGTLRGHWGYWGDTEDIRGTLEAGWGHQGCGRLKGNQEVWGHFGVRGQQGKMWGALGTLWRVFGTPWGGGDTLRSVGDTMGCFGDTMGMLRTLWGVLGTLWGVLGTL